ncbi:MAG TPA: HEAT repeat domain-containing protein [Thermoplasmata archaeon]|nr:HEAT repeat domain-containing protein [Thermoplasmata archaeon]
MPAVRRARRPTTGPPAVARPRGPSRARLARLIGARARTATPEERQGIAGVLGTLGGAAALAELEPLLSDPSDRVRRAALLAFDRSGGGGAAARRRVRTFLGDPAPRVRGAAAIVLGRRRDRASVAALLQRLEAPGSWEKPSVAIALGRIGDRRAVPALRRLASRPESWVRVCALHALGEIGAVAGRPAVRAHLDDVAWSVRGAAAAALGTLGSTEDVPRLLALLDDRHPWPRRGAVYALGRLGRTETAARLRPALGDPAPEVRVAACWSLGRLGDVRARYAIARVLATAPPPTGGEVAGASGGESLPGRNAEAYLFEAALGALARLPPGDARTRADRLLADAQRKLSPAQLDRPSIAVFSEGRADRPAPTLRELFSSALQQGRRR